MTPVIQLITASIDTLEHHMQHSIYNAEYKVTYARNFCSAALSAAVEMLLLRVFNDPRHWSPYVYSEYEAFQRFYKLMVNYECLPDYCSCSEALHARFPRLIPKDLTKGYEQMASDGTIFQLNSILLGAPSS